MWHGWLSEGNGVLIPHHHFVDSKYDDYFINTIGTRAYEHDGTTYLEWSDTDQFLDSDQKLLLLCYWKTLFKITSKASSALWIDPLKLTLDSSRNLSKQPNYSSKWSWLLKLSSTLCIKVQFEKLTLFFCFLPKPLYNLTSIQSPPTLKNHLAVISIKEKEIKNKKLYLYSSASRIP